MEAGRRRPSFKLLRPPTVDDLSDSENEDRRRRPAPAPAWASPSKRPRLDGTLARSPRNGRRAKPSLPTPTSSQRPPRLSRRLVLAQDNSVLVAETQLDGDSPTHDETPRQRSARVHVQRPAAGVAPSEAVVPETLSTPPMDGQLPWRSWSILESKDNVGCGAMSAFN